MTSGLTSTCGKCGASIYKEHIDSGIARYEGGVLMCPHCMVDYEKSHDATAGGVSDNLAPIAFDDKDDGAVSVDMTSSRVHTTAADSMLGAQGAWDDSRFKRPLNAAKSGATRCRIFHTKLSQAALGFMNNQINEWLDDNPEIIIKLSTSTIGQFEGKHSEPNLILSLFY